MEEPQSDLGSEISHQKATDEKVKGRLPYNLPSPSQDTPTTYDSDWHVDSALLFARTICAGLKRQRNLATRKVLCELIDRFIDYVGAYYLAGRTKLSSDGPAFSSKLGFSASAQPHEAERLGRRIGGEWARLIELIASARVLPADNATMTIQNMLAEIWDTLAPYALRAAAGRETEALKPYAVLPHFGRHFELVSFEYAPDIVVLGIPATSLYTPWNWTFLWHEMAGLFVIADRNQQEGVVAAMAAELGRCIEDDVVWNDWKRVYNEFEHMPAEFSDTQGRPNSWLIQNYAEEFVEDLLGELQLGPFFPAVLERQLRRVYRAPGSAAEFDLRHPPMGMRVAVAAALAHQLWDFEPQITIPDKHVDHLARVIAGRAEQLTPSRFATSDLDAIKVMVEQIRQLGQSPSLAAARPVAKASAAQTVMAAFVAAYVERLPGHAIRQFVYGSDESILDIGVQASSQFADRELDELLDMTFSRSDQNQVSEEGAHDHNGNPQNDDTIVFDISGVRSHQRNHAVKLSWTHRHAF